MKKFNIKVYSLGTPFPPSAKGVAVIFLIVSLLGSGASFDYSVYFTLFLFLPLFILGIQIFIAKRFLIIDINKSTYSIQKHFLGFKYGATIGFNKVSGLIIKYNTLSDKTSLGARGVLLHGTGSLNRYSDNQYHKESNWSVSLQLKISTKVNLINTDKETAIKVINDILNSAEIDVYSGVYKSDRKLNSEEVRKGKLTFITPPKSGRKR